jgi:radical SAM superfamily enzyme YgiQ (UPF0313 family)
MNILLVHPKMRNGPVTEKDRGTLRAKLMSNPEITLPSVAAAIPEGHNIRIIHENYEDIDYSETYDLVGISCFTMFAPQVYEIADKFRKKGIPVVLGGYHPTAMPKEAKQHADSVVIGEAELIFPRLIEDLQQNKLRAFYKADKLLEPKDFPPLRRDLLLYHPITEGIAFSRGCYNYCDFCSITHFFKHTYRKRPINNVIKELKSLSRKVITIHDANLTADLEYSKSLFRAMIKTPIRKKWLGNGTIFILGSDQEFLQLARESGCIGWTIGFESFCQESLNEANKKANKVEKYQEWIRTIRKYGMSINGLFMFGFDHDKPGIFQQTTAALSNLDIDAAEFNIITPLPGTPLYEKMKRHKRLLTKDWGKYTQTQVVFKPKNMTPEELYEGTRNVIKNFYDPLAMYKRWIRLLKYTIDPIQISTIITMDYSRRIWYKKEFGI